MHVSSCCPTTWRLGAALPPHPTAYTSSQGPSKLLGVRAGWGGRREPQAPRPGPYLLRHGGLHHARSVGLQAVIVAAVRAQLQKGPPRRRGEWTLVSPGGTHTASPRLGTRPFPVLNHKRCSEERTFYVNGHLSVFVHMSGEISQRGDALSKGTGIFNFISTDKQPPAQSCTNPRPSLHHHTSQGQPRASSGPDGILVTSCPRTHSILATTP